MTVPVNSSGLLTLLVGPHLSSDYISSLGGVYVKYESDFAIYADRHWSTDSYLWSQANYYDRAQIYYEQWLATGNQVYLDRGNALAEDYLHNYVEANNYGVATWWSMMGGVTAHYLINGDQASLTAVGKVADSFCSSWVVNNNWANLTDPTLSEGREQARVLESLTCAVLINAPSVAGNDFKALAASLVEKLLFDQHADGSRPSFVTKDYSGNPLDKPFMNGLLNEAMINYYEQVNADPRIISYVKANLDYMWANEWDPVARAFQYLDKDSPTDTYGDTPAADLNNLIVNGFGFVFAHTGDETYRTRGDEVFAGGVNGAWLDGSKQFNQQYANSHNYIAYAHGGTAPTPTTSDLTINTIQVSGLALKGTNKADVLVGTDGKDTIDGANGRDTITGEKGDDTLTGGAGVDTFRFSEVFGHDVITDFTAKGKSHDILAFSHSVIKDYASVMAHAVQTSSGVMIITDTSNSVLLQGVKLDDLKSFDFSFL